MLRKTSTDRVKVADASLSLNGYRVSNDYDAVSHFNNHTLPVLRDLDLFTTHSIPDYYGFSKADVRAAYMKKHGKGTPRFGKEAREAQLEEQFKDYLDSIGPVKVKEVSSFGLTFTTYDERAGRFVIDTDAYHDATEIIYAETPDELRALSLLNAAVDALNALHLDGPTPSQMVPGHIQLSNFIEWRNGKAAILRTMYPGPWLDLVNRVSKE